MNPISTKLSLSHCTMKTCSRQLSVAGGHTNSVPTRVRTLRPWTHTHNRLSAQDLCTDTLSPLGAIKRGWEQCREKNKEQKGEGGRGEMGGGGEKARTIELLQRGENRGTYSFHASKDGSIGALSRLTQFAEEKNKAILNPTPG